MNNNVGNAIEFRGNMHISVMPSPATGDAINEKMASASSKSELRRQTPTFGALFDSTSDDELPIEASADAAPDEACGEAPDDAEVLPTEIHATPMVRDQKIHTEPEDDADLVFDADLNDSGEADTDWLVGENQQAISPDPVAGAIGEKIAGEVCATPVSNGKSDSADGVKSLDSDPAGVARGTTQQGVWVRTEWSSADMERSGEGNENRARIPEQVGSALVGEFASQDKNVKVRSALGTSELFEGQKNHVAAEAAERMTHRLAPKMTDAGTLGMSHFSLLDSEPQFEPGSLGRETFQGLPGRADTGPVATGSVASELGLQRAETVRSAAAQAVEVFVRQPGKPVEITLNPQELGKVRMALSTTEVGVTVVILSDRPETLDLMRRNIDQLAQEFRNLGYESTNFQFGEEATGDAPHRREGEAYVVAEETSAGALAPASNPRPVSTGLDLRL